MRQIPGKTSSEHANNVFEPRLLTYPEAADYLRISERTLWSMVNDGQIKCVRVRHSVRFDRHELDRWIDEQQRRDG